MEEEKKVVEQEITMGEEKCCCHDKSSKKHDKCKCKKDDELQLRIDKLTKDNEELVNKVKLAQAELINYRKRKDEEVLDTLKYANKDLILEIIEIVDNFERAIINIDNGNLSEELTKYFAGFKIIYNTLIDKLKKFGVEEINRLGEIFDPTLEQALLTDNISDKADEEVLEVLLKGYKLKDRVIRPASVKINQL